MLAKPTNRVNVVFVIMISQDKFRFLPKVCDGCHDLMQNIMNFNDAVIPSVKGNDDIVNFWDISKDEAKNLMENSE